MTFQDLSLSFFSSIFILLFLKRNRVDANFLGGIKMKNVCLKNESNKVYTIRQSKNICISEKKNRSLANKFPKLDSQQNHKKLISELSNLYGCTSNENEVCFSVLKKYVKPELQYKNPNDWLSNVNINDVLHEIENIYPYFKSIDAVMIDDDIPNCYSTELCDFTLQSLLEKNKSAFAIVYNTQKRYDIHGKTNPGQHWVVLYGILRKTEKKGTYDVLISYFDSNGSSLPNVLLESTLKRMKNEVSKSKKIRKIEIKNVGKKLQYDDGQCGMFVIAYILHMLKNIKSNSFHSFQASDEDMIKLRQKIFSV